MSVYHDRREMFKEIGDGLVSSLHKVSLGKTDTTIQGEAGEKEFRLWLKEQLPKRYGVHSGTVVSQKDPPLTQRDCLIFDDLDYPPFRVSGGVPDIFPIEGVAAAIELNTGSSGASYTKVLKDVAKVSNIGRLRRIRSSPVQKWLEEIPVQKDSRISQKVAVAEELPHQTPLLLVFVETLDGTLQNLASKIAKHNKEQSIESSVDGVFALNKGVILHTDAALDVGWSHHREAGHNLAYMESQQWEVLLLMMLIIWNHLWKGTHSTTDLGRYYMDIGYFLAEHRPRIQIVQDAEYVAQTSESIPVRGFQITLPIQLVPDPDAGIPEATHSPENSRQEG